MTIMWTSNLTTVENVSNNFLVQKNKEVRQQRNKIYLNGEVNEENVDDIIEMIERSTRKSELWICINSYGGDVVAGLRLYDLIIQYGINTYATKAMSMGLMLFMAGRKRAASKNVIFMHHDISYTCSGKLEEHERQLEKVKNLKKIFLDRMLSEKFFTEDELKNYDTQVIDKEFNYAEAEKRGMINSTLESSEVKKEIRVVDSLEGVE